MFLQTATTAHKLVNFSPVLNVLNVYRPASGKQKKSETLLVLAKTDTTQRGHNASNFNCMYIYTYNKWFF